MRKNTGKNRIKMFSVLAVMLMVLTSVCVIENTEEADAASNPYYKYVMTYSGETITQVDIYDSPSHITKTITTKNALDSFWAFDTTTGYGPFNSCYAAINVSDGTVAFHMQPNNLKRQLGASSDMTSSELANYNIVWLIPTVYWSATSTTLTLTNSSTEGGTAYAHSVVSPSAKTYPFIGIGVYEASTTTIGGNTALMSQSGKAPTVSQTVGTFDGYGQNTPGDAILWNFYHWTFTKMATYMVGMGKNTQQIWGAGLTSGSAAATTGLGDTAGAYASGQTAYSKVFIENSWGSVYEWVGSTTFSSRTLYLTTTTGGNSSYASTIGTSQGVSLPSSGWITGTSKASATWDLPTSSSSTDNSSNVAYPGDYVDSNTGVRVLYVGGYWLSGTGAGVSYASGSNRSTGTDTYVGGRLAYYLDADAASTTTVTISPNTVGYGTVSQSTVSNIEIDSTITVNGNKLTFADGTEVTAAPTTNTAAYSYAFTGWSVSNGAKVTEDMTITANFSRSDNYYDVTISVSPSGYGTVNNQTTLTYNVIYGTTVSVDQSTKVLTVGSNSVTATPTTDSTGQYTYYLNSWYNASGPITADQTITAVFDRTINTYDVTITANPSGYGTVDGLSSKTVNVPYGTAITVNGSTIAVGLTEIVAAPITDQTGEYTYSFVNYTGTTATVTGNTSITANFSRALNYYDVDFLTTPTGYGSVSQSTTISVPWGTTATISTTTYTNDTLTLTNTSPSYSKVITATPTQDVSGQYTYSVSSWSVANNSTITADTNITVTFGRVTNQYTVTVTASPSGYGTVNNLSSTSLTVDYGTSISVNDNILTIGSTSIEATETTDNTGEYTYSFVNFTGTTATVTGNMTVTANFSRALNYYTVTINATPNGYGSVSQSQLLSVPWGTNITISTDDEANDTLTFTRLGPPYSGTVLATSTVDNTGHYTYSFTGWTVGGNALTTNTPVHGNMTIVANFSQALNYYTVTINTTPNGYGSVSQSQLLSVPWGTTITSSTYSETNDTLTFSNTTPSYSQTVRATSTDDLTGEYTYTFTGWTGNTGTVTGDMTITANFTRALNYYDITFTASPNGYGDVTESQLLNVPWGTVITLSTDAETNDTITFTKVSPAYSDSAKAESTVDPTGQYTYTFTGWTVGGNALTTNSTVQGDMTIQANFTRAWNYYTVTVASNNSAYGEVNGESSVTFTSVPWGTVVTFSTVDETNDTLSLTSIDPVYSQTATAVSEQDTPQYIYAFEGWSVSANTVITGNTTITGTFSQTLADYDVTVQALPDGYGTVEVVGTISDVPYGSTISISNNILTISYQGQTYGTVTATEAGSTVYYTYGFDGYTEDGQPIPANATITADRTIVANFTQTLNNYIVLITPDHPEYGEVSEDEIVAPAGSHISITTTTETNDTLTLANVSSVASVKTDATGQYTYHFNGWSVADNTEVVSNMTVYAYFTRTVTEYTVTANTDGQGYGTVNSQSTASISDVPYGTFITLDTTNVLNDTVVIGNSSIVASPIAATSEYIYAFAGWTVGGQPLTTNTPVHGDMTLVANFTRGNATCTVTFATTPNGYGSVDAVSLVVPFNSEITLSTDVATNDTLTVNNVDVLATPTTDPTGQYLYTFYGWSVQNGTRVLADMTVTATFEREVRTYAVSIASNNTDYGTVSTASLPEVPYGTIVTISTTNVTNDTLTFTNVGESYSQTVTATPTQSGAQYTYAFTGWSISNNAAITGATSITASFTQTLNHYTVTVVDDQSGYGDVTVASITDVPYDTAITVNGATITVSTYGSSTADPEDQTPQYTYSFEGWEYNDQPLENGQKVLGNMTITATFSRELRTYAVSIASNNTDYGTVSPTSLPEVPYGTIVTISTTINTNDTLTFTNVGESYSQTVTATPTQSGAQYTYTFGGWSIATNTAITGTTAIIGTFSQSLNHYTVTVVTDSSGYGNVTTSSITDVPYDTAITVNGRTITVSSYGSSTANPNDQTDQYTYTFEGWEYNDQPLENGQKVLGNMTVTANFDRDVRTYTITWSINGTLTYETYEYGQTPTHADPTKENYTFAGWSPSITTVTGDQTYTATWTPTQYTITFNPQGGTVSPTQATGSVETPVTAPLPEMAYYVCDGWYDENGILVAIVGEQFYPTQSMTVYAHWTAIEYTLTFNGNGGTPSQAASVGSQSSPITLPSATLEDHSFFAWFDVVPTEAMIEAGEDSPHFVGFRGSLYYPTKSMTVYAGWTDKTTFALSYDVNGGWYGPKTQSYSTDDDTMSTYTFTVTSDKPIWYAHTFMGWTTDLENPEVEYVAGDSITVNANATVVLHAVWIEGPAYGPFMNIMQLLPIIATIGLMISAVSYFILPRINAGATIKKVRR